MEDVASDARVYIGAAVLPIPDTYYESNPAVWMLRGYNGYMYNSSYKSTYCKFSKGDVVTVRS